jgi:hypothetical protein
MALRPEAKFVTFSVQKFLRLTCSHCPLVRRGPRKNEAIVTQLVTQLGWVGERVRRLGGLRGLGRDDNYVGEGVAGAVVDEFGLGHGLPRAVCEGCQDVTGVAAIAHAAAACDHRDAAVGQFLAECPLARRERL